MTPSESHIIKCGEVGMLVHMVTRSWREAACWFTWSQTPICIHNRRWKIGFLCRSSWLRQISGTLRPGAGLAERPSQQTWAWGPVAPIPLASAGTHILLQPLQQLVE